MCRRFDSYRGHKKPGVTNGDTRFILFRNLDDSNALLGGKILVVLSQVDDSLNQADDGGNIGPEKQHVSDTQTSFAKVKLVNAKPTEQNS